MIKRPKIEAYPWSSWRAKIAEQKEETATNSCKQLLILKLFKKRGCQITNFLLQYVKFRVFSRQQFHMKQLSAFSATAKPISFYLSSEVLLSQRTHQLKIISYEGSSYKTDFWEGQGREFEDMTERMALRRLLPPTGGTIVEIGAGFGRLADLYSGYEQIILLDYSLSLLSEAQRAFGENPKYKFIAANVYNLPLAANLADAVVMIRVAHHLESIDTALVAIHRVLRGGKVFVMEFANKRNAKSIARFLLRKQDWSPFDVAPYEFVPLNFDFHPAWMRRALERSGFRTERELAISNFRLPALKKRVSPAVLSKIDNAIAGPGARLKLSPSILTKNVSTKPAAPAGGFLVCPKCGEDELDQTPGAIVCPACGTHWPVVGGIFDFRYPRPEGL